MKPAISTSSSPSCRPTYSCVRCSDRKVKCDRQKPCSACVKHNVQCIFRPLQPPRKRHKRVRDEILDDRLKRYEALLQEQGIDPNGMPDILEPEQRRKPSNSEVGVPENSLRLLTPAPITSEPERSITKTQLLHGQGRSKFVDNTLWTRAVEEFHDPEEAFEDSSYDASDAGASEDDFGFVVGVVPNPNTRYPHPPTEHIHQLWQIFIENVDPLTKVVHVPTLQRAIQKASTEIGSVSRSFEALMFAIYSAAVMSLKDDECRRRLGESRKTLLSRYTSATKAALSRAKFMGTTSIIVLQALMLHLLSVRDTYEPRTLWALTGVAVRIAEAMGLHRDGTFLGLPPFEAEIRRRIWWQLKMNDFRTAELSGLAKFRGSNTDVNAPKLPANINDDELHPGMPSPATESTKPTDMIFCVLRSELGSFAAIHAARFRQQGKEGCLWDDYASRNDMGEKDEFIKEIEESLETKYLRYCDPSQPLQLMTMLLARSALNVGRFITHHPRRWASHEQTPESERHHVWNVSIKLLEQYNMVQSNRQLQRFAWHAAYFLPWHAFIHVLDTLRANPLMSDAVKTWQLVESVYENHPDMVSNTKKTIHRAVGNLCLKAFSAREAALMNKGKSIPRAPEYITKLRQREAVKDRRKARDAKSKAANAIPGYDQPKVNEMRIRPDSSMALSRGRFEPHEPQRNLSSQLTSFDQASDPVDTDAFWLTKVFDDGLLGTSSDIMSVDTEFMLAQDHTLGGTTGQAISWTQWDAWLGDLNMTCTNFSTSFEDGPGQSQVKQRR